MTRRRRLAILTLLSSVVLLVLVAALELGARLVGYRTPATRKYTWLRYFDSEFGWLYQPRSEFQHLTSEGKIHGSIDADGYRPVVEGRDRMDSDVILCIGDSFTFGAESPDDRTWPEFMARSLGRQGFPCRGLNRGVTGYSAIQSLLTLRRVLGQERGGVRTRAVVYLFCINDVVENFQKDRPHFDESVPMAGDARILPPEFPSSGIVHRSLLRTLQDRSAFLDAIRSEKIHDTADAFRPGAREFTDSLCPMFQRFVSEQTLQQGMRYVLQEMQKECVTRGVPLLVVSFVVPPWDAPSEARRELSDLLGWSSESTERTIASYQASFALLQKLVEEAGAHWVDVRGCMGGMMYREWAAAPLDWHYSTVGKERLGNAIATQVKVCLEARSKKYP